MTKFHDLIRLFEDTLPRVSATTRTAAPRPVRGLSGTISPTILAGASAACAASACISSTPPSLRMPEP